MHLLLTLSAGTAGGAVCYWRGAPIPWMIGPMLATVALLACGQHVNAMTAMRRPMVAVIGTMLGAGFSNEALVQAATWWLSVMGLIITTSLSAAIGFHLLHHLGRLDRPTAFFGAMPGGLVEMALMSEQFGGDPRAAFPVHTLRIFCVVLLLPAVIELTIGIGSPGSEALLPASAAAFDLPAAFWLLVCMAGSTVSGRIVRLPAPELLGPMIVSALLHATGVTDFSLPFLLVASAQLVIGVNVAARFSGVDRNGLTRLAGVSVLLVAIHLGCAFSAALAVAQLTNHDPMELLLAYSPGGITEMSVIALAMGGNIALVAFHHIARFTFVLDVAPIAYRTIHKKAPHMSRKQR